jgi:hypothetical protein
MKKAFLGSAIAAGAIATGTLLQATPAEALTFFGTGTNPANGRELAASVSFSIVGPNNNRLQIVLKNTGPGARNPSDVLTALFWDIAGNPNLNLRTATAPVVTTKGRTGNNPVPPSTQTDVNLEDVNGAAPGGREWNLAFNANGLGGNTNQGGTAVTQKYGLGSAGLGIFQGIGGGQQVDYGIVNGFANNSNNTINSSPFVNNTAIFELGGFGGFDLSAISNVRFQFGTALNEPNVPGKVPTPALLPGLIGMGVAAMRKKKKQAQAVQEAAQA